MSTLFPRKFLLVFLSALLILSLSMMNGQAKKGEAAPDAPDLVLTHTTVADFDQTCATISNAHISDNLGGSVELAGFLADTFAGTTLDSTKWVSGSWSGGIYTPVVSGGRLVLPPHGYVRSINTTINRGVLEAKAEFTQSSYEQVGFGVPDLEFQPRFLFFSTYNTSGITTTLYARVALYYMFYNENLNTFPTGAHRYKIQWLAADALHDQALFSLDGAPVYTSTPFTNTLLANTSLWMTNDGTQNLTVDEIQVSPPYATTGTYQSCPLDASAGNIWQSAAWVSSLPANTTLTIQTRTSADGSTNWSGWSTIPTGGGAIPSPNRFVQYLVTLNTTNASVTPALDSITLTSTSLSSDLSLTKTASSLTPDVGQTVDFTVTVNNAGPNSATNVEVLDVLQSGFTYSSSSATQGGYLNTSGVWTVGTIAAGGSATLTIRAVVNPTGIYTNAAEVSKNDVYDPDSTPGNGANAEDDYKSITVTPVQIADIRVTKTGSPDPTIAGNDVTYVVTVQNLGPSTATSVVMTDTLPTGVTYKSVTPGSWTCTTPATGKVRCTLASLGLTSSNVTIVATVNPNTRGSIRNVAEVRSATLDRNGSNNTAQADTAINAQADLELTKVARSSTPYMGSTQVFTVTVTNKGESQATGVKVKDLLGSGYQFSGATASLGGYDQGTGEWTLGSLSPNQSATLRLSGVVNVSGNYDNYAQVIASNEPDPDSTPNDNSTTDDDDAAVTVTPQPAADLSLVKLVSKNNPYVGESVVFTVTVTNAGPVSATGVTVKDLLNSGFTFVSSSQPGNYDALTGIWSIGTMLASESKQLRITATVKPTGNYQNAAEVFQSQVSDPDSTPGNGVVSEDDYGAVTLTPKQLADLSIVKTLVTVKPEKNKDFVFQIQVTNSGPSSADGVTIRDVLPANHVLIGSDYPVVNNSGVLTWDLGTLTAGQVVTIQLTVQASVLGSYTNQAQVWTSSVDDPDSVPGNSEAGEDDLSALIYRVNTYTYLPIVLRNP